MNLRQAAGVSYPIGANYSHLASSSRPGNGSGR